MFGKIPFPRIKREPRIIVSGFTVERSGSLPNGYRFPSRGNSMRRNEDTRTASANCQWNNMCKIATKLYLCEFIESVVSDVRHMLRRLSSMW